MFGITPMPIYDPNQTTSYLRDFMCLFKPGDIVKWKPIGREEYDHTVAEVDAGRWQPRIAPVTFSLEEFAKDIDGTNARVMEALNGH
jgi:urea carboxylase